MKSNTRQHFVPQFYLREWSDLDEKIWKYGVTGAAPIHISIDNVAFERGLYSHPAADKVPRLKTEKFFAAEIENGYAEVWPGIIDRAEDLATRKNLARFIALMILRHPQEKQTVQLVNEMLHETVAGLSPDMAVEFVNDGKSTKMRVDEILKLASDDKDAIQSRFLKDMPQLVMHGAETLVKRRWGVVVSDAPVFPTSDCPVVLCRGTSHQRNLGYGTPGTQILFPFCPTRLLVIDDSWPHNFGHYKLPQPEVFNQHIANGAVRFVYSHTQDVGLSAKIRDWRNALSKV